VTTRIVGCGDKERLVAYLYGEDTPAERAAVEAHVAICRECAAEVEGFRDVRAQLTAWQAPEVDLGYRVVRDPVPQSRRWWQATLPVWAQAAAAVLVLSAGAGLANLQIEYGANGVQLRTGWGRATAGSAPVSVTTPVASGVDLAAVHAVVNASEQKLRAEFAALEQNRQTVTVPASAERSGSATNEAMLRQVRALLTESEQRQRRELALRLTQVLHDVDTQRRADLVRIEQNMGQLEGATGQTADSLREQINYLVRVSQRR
jgi:anti-sigma factor ChrR (cupin superfamily)